MATLTDEQLLCSWVIGIANAARAFTSHLHDAALSPHSRAMVGLFATEMPRRAQGHHTVNIQLVATENAAKVNIRNSIQFGRNLVGFSYQTLRLAWPMTKNNPSALGGVSDALLRSGGFRTN